MIETITSIIAVRPSTRVPTLMSSVTPSLFDHLNHVVVSTTGGTTSWGSSAAVSVAAAGSA